MRRINVIGTSGSGKTTFSKQLAAALAVRHIEMDTLFWQPNWRESCNEEFFAKVKRELVDDAWVLDGNYTRTAHIKWSLADTLIWLDYSLPRTLFQVTSRSLKRALDNRELWPNTGNRESLRRSFFSRDSIVLWSLTTHRKNRRKYELLLADSDYAHMKFIRITSPKQARDFLASVKPIEHSTLSPANGCAS